MIWGKLTKNYTHIRKCEITVSQNWFVYRYLAVKENIRFGKLSLNRGKTGKTTSPNIFPHHSGLTRKWWAFSWTTYKYFPCKKTQTQLCICRGKHIFCKLWKNLSEKSLVKSFNELHHNNLAPDPIACRHCKRRA